MSIHQPLLYTHIVAGFFGLVVAPIAMVVRKGSVAHRRWGAAYFWSMLIVTLTALLLVFLRPNLFLLLIAILSFYQAFVGYRALYMKRPDIREGHKPRWMDWGATGLLLTASLLFAGLGVFRLLAGDGFGLVAIAFGVLGGWLSFNDIRRYRRQAVHSKDWFFAHMNGFLGAYIATVTAFSTTNLVFLPEAVRWLLPTVIGSLGIAYWNMTYEKRFALSRSRRKAQEKLASSTNI